MHTLDIPISIQGVGLHSGNRVQMTVQPSEKKGIRFYVSNKPDAFIKPLVTDKENKTVWHPPVVVDTSAIGQNHIRATSLTNGMVAVDTPEHFLAACYALELSNIDVFLNQSELPILDGSAIEFIQILKPKRLLIQDDSIPIMAINTTIDFQHNNSWYHAGPAANLTISAMLTYPNHWVQTNTYAYTHSLESFVDDIAPARTYGFTHELDDLRRLGLAKGGSTNNALVVSTDGYMNEPRFPNEMVRHKILDFIGDMAIGGHQLRGHFQLVRPSHSGNCEFLKQLRRILFVA